MSPFFVRQKLRSIKIGVYVVEAPNASIAEKLPLGDADYQGQYTDDGDNPMVPTETVGPFSTKEEAQKSEAGWIEDV